jgi:hypothetical protein
MFRQQVPLLEYGLHGFANGVVVLIERSGILRAARWAQILRGSQQRLDRFDSENHERNHCLESVWRSIDICVFARFAGVGEHQQTNEQGGEGESRGAILGSGSVLD